ncbi:MAG: cytochrome c [Pseudomonadales bacterium]
MFMRERFRRSGSALILLATTTGAGLSTSFAAGPDLGEPLRVEEIEAANLSVLPDGTGLPPGSGAARDGEQVYAVHCRACHGADGGGGPNDALVGGIGSLAGEAAQKTIGSYWPYATTVFDYIRRAMPYQQPGTLSADEVYAVTAYLLHQNGIIAVDAVMSAESLPRVEMPNRDGFRSAATAPIGETSP